MMDLFAMAPTFDDPIGMLRACHRRIERALEVIEKLAAREKEGPLDHQAREVLRQILCYFSTGVPRHAADEEESLFPRLRTALENGLPYPGSGTPSSAQGRRLRGDPIDHRPPGSAVLRPHRSSVLRTLDALECEHAVADAAHRELDALGEDLLRAGRFVHPEDRNRFNELIATLRRLYQEHIRIEDDDLFPLAESMVDVPEQDAIGTEMASRRGIDRRRHREIVAALESHPWSRRPPRVGQASRVAPPRSTQQRRRTTRGPAPRFAPPPPSRTS